MSIQNSIADLLAQVDVAIEASKKDAERLASKPIDIELAKVFFADMARYERKQKLAHEAYVARYRVKEPFQSAKPEGIPLELLEAIVNGFE